MPRKLKFTEGGFHMGRMLIMVAEKYATLPDVIKELIQNALDAKANKVWVTINLAEHVVIVRDNGVGASQEDIDIAMATIGQSQKDATALGRFGIGAVSPVGKLSEDGVYYFTSCPSKPHAQIFRTWTLARKDIEQMVDSLRFPVRERPEISGRSRSNRQIQWNTEARMEGVTQDRELSAIDLETLHRQILANFGQALKKLKAVIEIEFTDATGHKHRPLQIRYTRARGTRLPHYQVHQGTVRAGFDLIKVDRTPLGYKGEVRFGESGDFSGFRISLAQFLMVAIDYLSQEARDALRSGLFDGDIIGDTIKLTPSRRGFHKGDQLRDFCIAIDRWYEEVGRQHMEVLRDEKLDAKRQKNGAASMAKIRAMLLTDEFAHLLSGLLRRSTYGTQGSGHTPTPDKEVGEQDDRSVAVDGESRQDGERKASRRKPGQPSKEREDHVPTTVVGPDGVKRLVVEDNSLGLQFSYFPNSADKRLWELFPEEGRLNFNVAHELWTACEEGSDTQVQLLQELLTIHALSLYADDPKDWGFFRDVLDKTLKPTIYLIIKRGRMSNHLRLIDEAAG
jgi:hypothetical protein